MKISFCVWQTSYTALLNDNVLWLSRFITLWGLYSYAYQVTRSYYGLYGLCFIMYMASCSSTKLTTCKSLRAVPSYICPCFLYVYKQDLYENICSIDTAFLLNHLSISLSMIFMIVSKEFYIYQVLLVASLKILFSIYISNVTFFP